MPSKRKSVELKKTRPSKPARRPARAVDRRQLQAALAGLAHEVRTPLNGILAMADLLAASDLPARERKWATALTKAAQHLSDLTAIIVDGARAEAGTLVPRRDTFDAHALAHTVSPSLEARALAKGLDAEIDIASDLPHAVVGDPVLLRAAIENLLDNAVKFTEQGRVVFSAKAETAARGKIRLSFSVADDGVGLSPVEIRRLFRPFAQANAKIATHFGGAGLGLAFTRQIARAMGADVTVTSEPGRGSVFRFEALVEPAEPAVGTSTGGGNASAPAPAAALRILCAEDNPYGRVTLKAMVTALGHAIDFVATGEAAVEAVAASGYDLVLMDVTLSGIDGIEATRRIRALVGAASSIPIIGISGHDNAAEKRAARAAGMNDYLVKPVSALALATAIAALAR